MLTEKEVRRAKLVNTVVLIILAVILCICVTVCGVYKYKHTFTSKKWRNDIQNRDKIVGDMLDRYSLVGMKESEVIKLLGQDDGQNSDFKISHEEFLPESTLVYYLGIDYMEYQWLILTIENGVVTKYCMDVT